MPLAHVQRVNNCLRQNELYGSVGPNKNKTTEYLFGTDKKLGATFHKSGPPTLHSDNNADLSLADQVGCKFSLELPQKTDPVVHNICNTIRMTKTKKEIHELREVAAATVKAAAFATATATTAGNLETLFEQNLKTSGIPSLAFPTIVAVGKNGNDLHHFANPSQPLDNIYILDCGGRDSMCCDFSITLNVKTPMQKMIHNAVLAALNKCLNSVKPGISLRDLERVAKKEMSKNLPFLGNVSMDDAMWHLIGHCVGLEVHDPTEYSSPLKPQMVIAIEPGFYTKRDYYKTKRLLSNISSETANTILDQVSGIRLERTVLVTKTGCEDLTSGFQT